MPVVRKARAGDIVNYHAISASAKPTHAPIVTSSQAIRRRQRQARLCMWGQNVSAGHLLAWCR